MLCAQHANENWYLRLGSVMHADAIMVRVVSSALWINIGSHEMRVHAAADQ